MKKELLIIAVFSAMVSHLHAQNGPQKNPNETFFLGHLIRVYPTPDKGYGYDVFFQNRLIIHQSNNPFTASIVGLKNREDAFKIAKWQVIHLQVPGAQTMHSNQTVPKEVAHQLKITDN